MEIKLLADHRQLALSAFHWTSFDPEKRGMRVLTDCEQELTSDLESIPEGERKRYIEGYKKYFAAWLSACSNCASSAITGGSGFNVRRAEKANNRENARMEEFIQWREKALKAIAKRVKESTPEEEAKKDAWAYLEKSILRSAKTIHGINIGIERGYIKSLFVSSIYNKVETYAKKGDTYMVQKAVDCIRNFNETMSIVITERHKFFQLPSVAEAVRERLHDKANQESSETPFKGGRIVRNFRANRIQLIFDEKPSPEMISQLKKAAFKWSPRFGAWQRQLTNNASYATDNLLKSNGLL